MGNLIFGGGSSAQDPQQQAAPPQQSSGNLIFGGGGPAPAPTTGNVANLGGLIPQMPNIPGTPELRTAIGKGLNAQVGKVKEWITGVPASDPDRQMQVLRHKIPGVEPLYESLKSQNPAIGPNLGPLEAPVQGMARGLHHAARGLIDASIQQPIDPVTYESLGLGRAATALKAGGELAPIVNKALNANHYTQGIHDFFNYGGEASRAGYDVAKLQGAANASSRTGQFTAQRMAEKGENYLEGKDIHTETGRVRPGVKLTDNEKLRVNQHLNGEEPEGGPLTDKEAFAAKRVRYLTDADLRIRRHAAATIIRGKNPGWSEAKVQAEAEDAVPARENYSPGSHQLNDEIKGREQSATSPLDYRDPRALEREDFKVTSPDQLMNGIRAMSSNTGRQVATEQLHKILGPLIEDPVVERLFKEVTPATGDFRNNWQKFTDDWSKAIGYPRAGVVSTTPRHVFNIYDVAVNTVPIEKLPAFTWQSGKLIAKLMASKGPRQYEAALAKEGPEGAVSGDYMEKKPFFQNFPQGPTQFMGEELPKHDPVAIYNKHLAGKQIPLLAKYSAFMNKLTWAADEAFKTIYKKMIGQTGEAEGLRAGGMSARRLIDYQHRSPFQDLLSGRGIKFRHKGEDIHIPTPALAPFGTFRGGITGAVLGGVARNPARAAFIDRATGGALYGDKPQHQGDPGLEFSNPTADVGRGLSYGEGATSEGTRYPISGPGDFLRSTIGSPIAMGSDVLQNVTGVGQHFPDKNWATYGQGILPARNKTTGKWDIGALANYALSGIPEAQAVLQAMGISRFQWRGLAHEAVRQATGVQYNPPQQP